MKLKIALFILTIFCIGCTKDPQIRAAYDLIERVTPGYGKQFKLELIEPVDGQDAYEITSVDGKVLLRGNNTVSLATAYNQYLKYTCNAHVSWFGDQLDLPEQLPLPEKEIKNTINGKYRVYMNYCTVSYTAAWWDWDRWQRELDYMAMNSINMPLSVVGLEAVWYNTLLKYGFTDEEARAFLAGPGHFAWQWMQNLQSYGGPLPKSWIDSHVELGKKVIDRQLELGMQPIQQGFSGYVPRELKNKYPDAKIQLQPSWCGFTGAAQLDPTDPLFSAFGRDFLEEEKRLFGAHGVYAADPFHESRPPVDTPEYLSAVGNSIYELFKNFDPSAMWVMQAWSLREPIVKAVPKEHLLILDLNGGRSRQENTCWGYPVVAGNLHNFGGRINLHGDLRLLASNQYVLANRKSSNVCGSGLFMESIEQNPVYYDLAFEIPLHTGDVDVEEWLGNYAKRRYGAISENAHRAWLYLLEGPYRPGTNGTERSSIIAARPALNVKKSGPNAGLGIPYSPLLVIRAQGLLLKDAGNLKASAPYRFDVVDIQRQLMSNLGQAIHKKAAEAFEKKDKAAFALHSSRFLEMLRDADILLRTRPEFNFDKWLTDARSWGTTGEEKDLLEKDATALVTIWGADGDPLIFDYSWREWSGLIDCYYLKRWEMFYAMLQKHLDMGKDYSEKGLPMTHGREAFRANEFYSQLGDWELEFVSKTGKARTPVIQGDEIETVQKMYKKYATLAREYYQDEMKADNIQEGNIFENLGE
ncbi:alpha-N-acetylglucosaminidase [Parabacteroides faecis]|uniref:alpha-N-acetylglucosaminidase n=1 Tax=Parabacteroides TaxID=375288 RepID=UPI000EFF2BF8|nr:MULTISPECIES: alpha-N-acetylglucosaminidase [Parabacteroides]MBC8620068.1 alpha-N-acetylglucosaminidase [Parabacteroides faecis]RHR96432.1 alpha-N-acetylglucosaminidase [Parabacteroides sp. AF14-59]